MVRSDGERVHSVRDSVLTCTAAPPRGRAMLGIHNYWLFLVSGIVLSLTPGQDTMYILGRSLTGGWRAGVASAFGITVGSVMHTLGAAAGLSVLLATFAPAFTGVKLCGAAYLVILGAKL